MLKTATAELDGTFTWEWRFGPRGTLMMQVDPRDAVFVYVETPSANQTSVSTFAFDSGEHPEPGRDELLRWITERADRIGILRQRMIRIPFDLDHPYWAEDPAFAAEDHVVFHDGRGWEELRTLLADIQRRPLNPSRPLWEIHIVTGVAGVAEIPGDATVVAIKMHHSMADGGLGAKISRQLFTENLPTDERPAAAAAIPSRFSMAAAAVSSLPRNLCLLAGLVPRARRVQRLMRAERAQGMYEVPAALRPRTVLNQPLGPERVFDAVFFSVPELRAMRSAIGGVTVNDLMLTIVGSTMHRYLCEVGTAPEGSLAAGVPLSTRNAAEATSRNRFVTLAVDLHTDLPDLVERARAIHRSVLMDTVRKTGPGETQFDALANSIPGFVVRNGLRVLGALPTRQSSTIRLANTLVTNVPKGPADMVLCGSTVAANFGVAPLVGLGGVVHSISSVGDSLAVNITADPRQLRDDGRYVELLRESFEDLKAAIYP
ncbi:WS/DGAT/MGAT family acyltransferase [Rhodococcus sp. OK611]|uniref:wax ester/triacylglycerol synthase domain-containing protein n=1 Tax=Rhodococcus TaxID=1827 RepID=UPI000BDC7B2F|nr:MULTISPECIES: wax ester/triacylglycerol synthase domain-containing protein [Rhodococcus]MCZ4557226.1 WS/DGAT domain-containing protein [Rhodococcus maanshanensis]PTR42793.1 WS/DGAT/MGAT family acyltransferase [Rhodococcus sp. OK611]SNX91850.1 acyltransferase, WS/DGAT/MGAT [Rhodococcus sp. OK270]